MNIILNQSYSFNQIGVRDNQEDARYPDIDTTDNKQRFFIVCDGVGGSEKGELASRTVCDSFALSLKNFDFTKKFSNEDFRKVLDHAYDALDKKAKGENKEMATTLAFVCFHGDGCTMVHIGDSRVYLIRPSEGILYRSDDHSLVNSMVHNGVITPEEAIDHPQQNIITRYMEPVNKDENRCQAAVIRWDNLIAGDYVFLCSDGVIHCLTDEELTDILSDPLLKNSEKIGIISEKCKNSSDNNTAWLIPIARVEGIYDHNYSDEDSTMSQTKRLHIDRKGTEDVESLQLAPHKNFKEWFKNLFN